MTTAVYIGRPAQRNKILVLGRTGLKQKPSPAWVAECDVSLRHAKAAQTSYHRPRPSITVVHGPICSTRRSRSDGPCAPPDSGTPGYPRLLLQNTGNGAYPVDPVIESPERHETPRQPTPASGSGRGKIRVQSIWLPVVTSQRSGHCASC